MTATLWEWDYLMLKASRTVMEYDALNNMPLPDVALWVCRAFIYP